LVEGNEYNKMMKNLVALFTRSRCWNEKRRGGNENFI